MSRRMELAIDWRPRCGSQYFEIRRPAKPWQHPDHVLTYPHEYAVPAGGVLLTHDDTHTRAARGVVVSELLTAVQSLIVEFVAMLELRLECELAAQRMVSAALAPDGDVRTGSNPLAKSKTPRSWRTSSTTV